MSVNTLKAIKVDISPGELVDKITILEIKNANIENPEKLENVRLELSILRKVYEEAVPQSGEIAQLERKLKLVNESLWQIEDDIRDCERQGDFGDRFIQLARSVYRENDKRASVKREINVLLGSQIVEEKSYASY